MTNHIQNNTNKKTLSPSGQSVFLLWQMALRPEKNQLEKPTEMK
jgi:hypothetical protein